MSGAPRLDGRRAGDLDAELERRALAVLSGDGRSPPLGPITEAILAVAGRIGEEVTQRLDRAPAKQADNFYTAAGIGRDPARPATVPVAFALAEGARAVQSAPARTQLMVDADGPVIFETATRIDLAPGNIAALRGLDAEADAIQLPSAAVMAAALPRPTPAARRLRSGAAAGAAKLQVDPAAGLQPGTLLQLGTGDAAREYLAAAVEGDLVTIEPALEAALPENAPVAEVSAFAPFAATTRNHQSHAFYLGHSKLLDVPSAVMIKVTGTALPADAAWSWWGQLGDDDPPAWHDLTPDQGGGLAFTKEKGKPANKKIGTQESLWLRAKLPGRSAAPANAQDVRIAVGGKLCAANKNDICRLFLDELNVGFEAFANTTPLVTNSPFQPFGSEPRLFDSFYVGSDEAFSKAGADVSLCFDFGGPDFGPLAAVQDARGEQVFALGAGNALYRADFRVDPPVLLPVPQPAGISGGVPGKSALVAWSNGTDIRLALGARGAVHVALLSFDSKLDPASVKWVQLALDAAHRPLDVDRLVFSGPGPSLFAKAGTALFRWDKLDGDTEPVLLGETSLELLPVQDGGGALVAVESGASGPLLRTKAAADAEFSDYATLASLPEGPLTAWARSADFAAGVRLHISGYAAATDAAPAAVKLVRVDRGGTARITDAGTLPVRVPLLFEDTLSTRPEAWPSLLAATPLPTRFLWTAKGSGNGSFRSLTEAQSIGTSASLDRAFLVGGGRTIVQRTDSGLLYRGTEGSGEKAYPVTGEKLAVSASGLPAGTLYLTLGSAAAAGGGFTLADESMGWRLLAPLPGQVDDAAAATGKLYLAADPATTGEVATTAKTVRLFVGPATVPDPASGKAIVGTPLGVDGTELDLLVSVDGAVRGIWHLTRSSASAPSWSKPSGFPDPQTDPKKTLTTVTYAMLNARPPAVTVSEAVTATIPIAEQGDLAHLHSSFDSSQAPTLIGAQDSQAILLFPHDLIAGDELLLAAAPEPWKILGPGAAANPTLSWEYWNGESWWALGNRELRDDTANFQKGGGIFFKAPADIRPTDVGGTTRYWIRARLVGGDYGEPKVTVTTGPAPGGGTEQVATRDVSSVRAPYVTALRLGYCASEPVRPEIVLTEDSLGTIDQTSANEAGLQFPVFTPVATLMNPVSAAAATAEAMAASESCDDPCPPPEPPPPSPCDAPGAYASCDSPCLCPPAGGGPAGEEETGFVRGLMIGFSKPFAGETVSLYVDADPSGAPTELVADILRGGRFAAADLVTDTSYGMTEPGILTLALPGVPDMSDLFGASACWLRLRPKSAGAVWAPRLRGLYLNAVVARSVETHAMERLGQSIGVADQLFQLSEPPVDPDPHTFELRVHELLADEERADPALDVATYAAGPAGEWVRWTLTEDLVESGDPQRLFMLDAEGGGIRFGNKANGRIPPLGADIMAVRYAHVTGSKANAVVPGQTLQTLSPLAGVEKVIALDNAAGGSDAEALDSARRRAAAKVRHGGRILSRADLEDYAMTLAPDIAQVRADRKGGAVRLIVAMAGAEPRPSPAQLRGFGAAIRAVSGFGLARSGGLDVVAPRLLPLAVRLVLRPLSPDSFAEAAAEAKTALAALLDPATGNHDGDGWPLGQIPDAQDVAAALAAIETLAMPEQVVIERADRELAAERALPASLPPDVLVRLDSVALERAREEAA